MAIDGRTGIYALIGDPIGHARTPGLYNAKFGERGLNVAVVPVHVPPSGLRQVVEMARTWRNLVGIGVTIPHKEAMAPLVDDLTEAARLCGATNVIRREADGRLVGTQMDGPGFVQSLRSAGFDPAGRRVLLAGAGGTAKAIAFALAGAGAGRLTIVNRTLAKAEALAAGVGAAYPGMRVEAAAMPAGLFDLVVNATSLGMKASDPLPVDERLLEGAAMVADVVMSPPRTSLLAAAAQRGCRTHPGVLMLEAQFDATVDFLGLAPSADLVAAAARQQQQ